MKYTKEDAKKRVLDCATLNIKKINGNFKIVTSRQLLRAVRCNNISDSKIWTGFKTKMESYLHDEYEKCSCMTKSN